jgi:hypothetical protein
MTRAASALAGLWLALAPSGARGQEVPPPAAVGTTADPATTSTAQPVPPPTAQPSPAAAGIAVGEPTPGTDPDGIATVAGADGVLPASLEGEGDPDRTRLDIYGFGDLTYYKPLVPDDSPWLSYFPPKSSFIFGDLNLYLAGEVGRNFRTMAEVRFLFVPNGAQTSITPDSGIVNRMNTEVMDPGESGRFLRWGSIEIQRAFAEYAIAPWLVVRAGHFLTPYGIWIVDHGAPTIIGIRRPWTIREQLLPEHQTGLELHGRLRRPAGTLGYHLTLANGRGPTDTTWDTNDDKAIGGRAYWESDSDVRWTAGASGYMGRVSEWRERWLPGTVKDQYVLEKTMINEYDELAWAVDLRVDYRGWRAQAELVANRRTYTERGRPLAIDVKDRAAPDLLRYGSYGLVGYRTPWFGVMPYFMVEYFHMGPNSYSTTLGSVRQVLQYQGGLNLRPFPALVLKAELFHAAYPSAPAASWGAKSFSGVQGQIAWVF